MSGIIAIGSSNWDYILTESGYTRAIAKENSGACDSTFGDIKHFKKVYLSGHIGALTDLGKKIVGIVD